LRNVGQFQGNYLIILCCLPRQFAHPFINCLP
jgi:hypothetical protein